MDHEAVSWLKRLTLQVLTPEQTQAYLRGTRAENLILQGGQTLSEYLRKRPNPAAVVFVGLPGGCEVFSDEGAAPGQFHGLRVRGLCGIPKGATALLVTLQAESPNPFRVKLWAADLPEPVKAVWEPSGYAGKERQAVSALVRLCANGSCPESDLMVRVTESALLQDRVIGHFRPLRIDNTPGRVVPMATESTLLTFNDFLGYDAGEDATGNYNAFFGKAPRSGPGRGEKSSRFPCIPGNSGGRHASHLSLCRNRTLHHLVPARSGG